MARFVVFSDVSRIIPKSAYSALCGPSIALTRIPRQFLSKFPITGPRVLMGPGEGAGIVDIGDNQAVVFKIESP